MKRSTRSLFGGTLLSAGLMTGVAHAQQFQIGYSSANTYAYTNGGGFNSTPWNSNGPFTISASSSDQFDSAYGSVDIQPTHMTLKAASASSYNYCFGHGQDFVTYFSVDKNLVGSMNWDWTSLGLGFGGYARIDDLTNGVNLFSDGPYSTDSGSQQISFSANTQYKFVGYVDSASLFSSGSGHSELTVVPAPQSAGLLGVAGLAATRRRRQNR